MKTALALVALILLSPPAGAQQFDPRLAPAALDLLKAQVAYLQTALAAAQADAERREREWAEYAKPLWRPNPEPSPAK